MQLDLTKDQERIRDGARDLAARVLPASFLDDRGPCPAEALARMGAVGALGVTVPTDHGGAGLDLLSAAIVIEEISAASAGAGTVAWATNALFCEPLARFGTAAQRSLVLAAIASGQAVGALAAHDGTPATAIEERADGSFVVRGSKRYVLLGAEAAHVLVVGETARGEQATSGKTAVLVPSGTPGVAAADAVGRSCTLVFDAVEVPRSCLVGDVGEGERVLAAARGVADLLLAAHQVGLARAAVDEAAAHLRERRKTVAADDLQSATFLLVDLATELDAARLLTHRAATREGARESFEGSLAKVFACEMAVRTTLRVLGILGRDAGAGLERLHRAARLAAVEGSLAEAVRAQISARETGREHA